MRETVPGRYYYERGGPAAPKDGSASGEPAHGSPHDHVRFVLDNGVTITYNDPRRFGFMTLVPRAEFDRHPLFRGIGVEPLGEGFDAASWRG